MKALAQQTICAALIEELTMITDNGLVNEIRLASIAQRAQHGRDEDPEHYLNVMGVVSSLRGNNAETDEYFQRCIKSFGGSLSTYYNYAQALHQLGRNFDALRYVNKAAAIAPTDVDVATLEMSIQHDLIDDAWDDMESDTEERLTKMCQCQMAAG